MQHVRIGQHERRVSPDPVTFGRGCVAVVRGGAYSGQVERTNSAELVVRQCLGGSEIERPGGRLGQQVTEHGHEVSQRLTRSRTGRQYDAASAMCMLGGERLMAPRLIDPGCTQP